MRPSEYFPYLYLKDLRVFMGERVIGNGPQWMLCGWTMARIFEPQMRVKYKGIEEFVTVLYELNLINQGIHAHFNEDFGTWCVASISFPDCLACPSFHGGVSLPNSILRFTKNPSNIPQARPVNLDMKMLKDYTHYFFKDYLRKLEGTANFKCVTSVKVIEKLRNDHDCFEFHQLLNPLAASTWSSDPRSFTIVLHRCSMASSSLSVLVGS